MKNLISKIILLFSMLSLANSCLTTNEPLETAPYKKYLNKKFSCVENYEKMLWNIVEDLDGDTIGDRMTVAYDMNKNKKRDCWAEFLSKKGADGRFYMQYAANIFVDSNEDGRWDYRLEDSNGDEKLDRLYLNE